MKYLFIIMMVAACSGPTGKEVVLTEEEAPGTCQEITEENVLIKCSNKNIVCFGGK